MITDFWGSRCALKTNKNPVQSGRVIYCELPKDWPWSSYRQTAGINVSSDWLTTEWLLAAFGKRLGHAQQKYREFVAEGKGQPSPWESLQNQVFLGSDDYVEKLLKDIDAKRDLSERPKSQRRAKAKPIEWYKAHSATRDEGIEFAYSSGGYSMKEIGVYYGLHYSRVSRILSSRRKAKGKT